MHYEQKQIPPGTGNFYWYRRIIEGDGRQRSEYIGRRLSPEMKAEIAEAAKLAANREREDRRSFLENQIATLTIELESLT